MTDSKLIELLKTLDSREATRFQEFVEGSYFNKHEQVAVLCEYLLKQGPDYDNSRKLSKAKVFSVLYPKKPLNENLLASIQSKLLKLLQRFMAIELFLEDEPSEILLTMKAMRLRNAEKHFNLLERQFQRTIERQAIPIDELSLELSRFYQEQDLWFLMQGGRTYHEALQGSSDQLDLYYFVEKLRLACDMTNRNIVTDASYDCKMIPFVIEYLRSNPSYQQQYPILGMYLIILDLLQAPEEQAHYQKLIAALARAKDDLVELEQRRIYDYALNYCVKQINAGNTNYYEEVLRLYQLLLERRLIYLDGQLPAWEYKNIVTAAVRMDRFDWAKDFIESYKQDLPADIRENAYIYNLASLYYASRQHKEALQSLHNVEFTDSTYHLGAKIIQVKSYFELAEWEALHSALDAFAAYIRRHKEIGEYRKAANLNFVNCCKQLCRLFEQRDWLKGDKFDSKLAAIAQSVAGLSPLASKDWLAGVVEL